MSIEILMPALSPTMTAGKLAKWCVKEGEEVKAGSVIAEIETDKATMEFEAADDGILGKILVPAGPADVPVNQVIAVLLEDGESLDQLQLGCSGAGDAKGEPSRSGREGAPGSGVLAPGVPGAAPTAPTLFVEKDPDLPAGVGCVHQTVREALRDAMAEEMRRDPDVFVLGEEVGQYQGAYKVTQGLLQEFGPDRVVDTPISEHGFAGLGVGAAFAGLRPVVEFMTFNFAMQAIDQVINSAAKTLYMSGGRISCPIVFRGPNGAASRVGAQHSQDYAAWYAHVPGLKVVAPYSAADAKGLLKAAIRDPNPVVFLESELLYGKSFDVPDVEDYVLPIGRSRIVKEGVHATVVSYSRAVELCIEAVDVLQEEGISCELIDLRTLRPLDVDAVVESVKKTGRMVSVDQTWPVCGVGSELVARVQEKVFDYLDAPMLRITQKDVPMPYAANLERLALPRVQEIVNAVRAVCYRSK